ncbi:uncharacterized protein LOC119092685 [Pollicipes pollicipes]|uniref:uncharacterized protein LOC119092685 n=1 Tax=Pollicipes pollicipes TaxID=41117 RepID=UPI001884D8A6|nr:uncharacterized protein LOC119092685 [Pollicipes pollicipes]
MPQQLTASCYRDVMLSALLERRAQGLGAAFASQRLDLAPTPMPDEAVDVLFAELGRPAVPSLPSASGHAAHVTPLSADCPACCLPLRNRQLLNSHGLQVFGCGHAFHAVCLLRRGGACLLCQR